VAADLRRYAGEIYVLTRILCVDDEPNILLAMERQLRKQFEVHTALGPVLGLQAITEKGPFVVVVSDLRMPVMDGIEFLTRVRAVSPDTVRIMLTGQADIDAAIAAVNQGNIFQFLTKPCPVDTLTRALNSAVEQHRLITAERELLEETLRGSIAVLSEILSLVNPLAFGRAQRIRRYVVHMAAKLDLQDRWQFELAAMLSQIGSVTVPPDVLDKYYRVEPLTAEEAQILAAQSRVGHDLLARIPRLEVVARMVAHQETKWTHGTAKSDAAATGAALLKVARDFDEQMTRGAEPEPTLAAMKRNLQYNPDFVDALQQVHVEESYRTLRLVSLAQLRAGMIMQEDVRTRNGLLLFGKGQEVTESAIARLKSFAQTVGIVEPLRVVAHGSAQTEVAHDPRLPAYTVGESVLR
jgi:response regulator RpfG family c-di-GMP phosphodiesterase